jgi:hypothetical protein
VLDETIVRKNHSKIPALLSEAKKTQIHQSKADLGRVNLLAGCTY